MPQLAGKEVGPIGLGLMGLTWRDVPPSQEQAFAVLRAALKNGSTWRLSVSLRLMRQAVCTRDHRHELTGLC